MKLTIWLAVLLLPLLMCSCWATKQVKQVSWQDYTFQLAVSDGGATTSFNWKVTARYPGIFGTREKLLFEAYDGPFLTDIQVEGSTLVLVSNDNGHQERIELDLQHVDAYLDDPVQYRHYTLQHGNIFYHEPPFIQSQREHRQQIDLEAAQRRREREAGQN